MYSKDLLYVCKLGVVNEALASAGGDLPKGCSLDAKVSVGQIQFGTWSVAPTLTATQVFLTIAIASGKVSFGDKPAVDLAGATMTFNASLAFFGGSSDTQSQTLKFDLQKVSETPQPGAISPYASTLNEPLGEVYAVLVMQTVAQALVDDAHAISFAFAHLTPKIGTAAWLQLKSVSFACAQGKGEPPALAIYGTSDPNDQTGFTEALGKQLLTAKEGCAFAVSPVLFMTYLFRPGLAKSLGGEAKNFAVSDQGDISSDTAIAMPKIKDLFKDYHPEITSVTAQILDTKIHVVVKGKCRIGKHVKLTFTGTSYIEVSYDAKRQIIDFTPHDVQFAKDVTETTKHFNAVATIAEWIAQGIGDKLSKSLKATATEGHIGSNAPSLVSWAGGSGFAPQSGGFTGYFYLLGKPN